MPPRKKTTEANEMPQTIIVPQITRGHGTVYVVGTSPLILNRMSEKARQSLVFPRAGRMTAGEKATNLKHNPFEEYNSSAHKLPDGPSLLGLPAPCFKKSMASAAGYMPGLKRIDIARLCWCEGEKIAIYGEPQLHMATVRSSDIARTPDIRTRCIIPRWAAKLDINFVQPFLNANAIAQLLAAAGEFMGVGDYRGERGSGHYGAFRTCYEDDAEFQTIVKTGGRQVQLAAMADPDFYDDETRELYLWVTSMIERRGRSTAPAFEPEPVAAEADADAEPEPEAVPLAYRGRPNGRARRTRNVTAASEEIA